MGACGAALRGMRERMRQIEGTLELSGETGTIVIATVPIAKTRALSQLPETCVHSADRR